MFQRIVNPSNSMSFFLFGARGTGKSTWLQGRFFEGEHLWVDLTNPGQERRYARRPEILLDEWKALNETLSRKKKVGSPWIVIDVGVLVSVSHHP